MLCCLPTKVHFRRNPLISWSFIFPLVIAMTNNLPAEKNACSCRWKLPIKIFQFFLHLTRLCFFWSFGTEKLFSVWKNKQRLTSMKSHLNADIWQSVNITIYATTPKLLSLTLSSMHETVQQQTVMLVHFLLVLHVSVCFMCRSSRTIAQLFTVSIKLFLSFANLLSLFHHFGSDENKTLNWKRKIKKGEITIDLMNRALQHKLCVYLHLLSPTLFPSNIQLLKSTMIWPFLFMI